MTGSANGELELLRERRLFVVVNDVGSGVTISDQELHAPRWLTLGEISCLSIAQTRALATLLLKLTAEDH